MEPIAITGIGCRFPQAPNPQEFWQLLCNGVDAITKVPADRWEISQLYHPDADVPGKMSSRYGGFLDQVDRFDPHLFGISPREAVSMDPQQRLLMEVAWEALEDGGQVRETLAGSKTGVFIGISTNDYSRVESDYATQPQGYDLTGNALNIVAGRLSYSFNLRGPSMVVDTACSSSLVAVHLACQSLWNQEATMALAGGVNIILSPIGTLGLTKLKALSPDGRCKAFDASANGYVRSEGAGCVVLKPLSQALADGDPVYATIRGSAINHDGRSKGLTVPYGPSQSAVVRDALTKAKVCPGEVSYIEAHGTGTGLGDPIEVMALAEVLKEQRRTDSVCALGAVKSNIGHLEAAAGIASLIKVVLSLKHGQIPPSLHFQQANPHIPFEQLPLRVQTALTLWPKTSGLAKAGVSAFGFAGTNAHVVLEQAPAEIPCSSPSKEAYLLPLSAHTPEALQALVQSYGNWLKKNPDVSLKDLCYTASARRTHHKYRLALVAHSLEDLQQRLSRLDEVPDSPIKRRSPKVAFVFTGDGAQWLGMGQTLLQSEPVFRGMIQDCDALIRDYADWSLLAELTADREQSRLPEAAIAQPTIFAIQVALAHLWRHWGIEPKAVVGHGLGEIAAAYVAGRLRLRDAVRLVCDRAQSPDAFITTIERRYELYPAKLPLFSTAAADWITETDITAAHWGQTLTAPNDLASTLAALTEAGYATLLEISPTPQLSDATDSLRPDQPERATLLAALGRLYTQGQPIHWAGLFSPGCRVLPLPLFPWQRDRYWVEKTAKAKVVTNPGHPLIGQPVPLAIEDTVFTAQLSLAQQPWLGGHRVSGLAVLPGAAFLEMALAAAAQTPGRCLKAVSIQAAMVLPESDRRQVQMIVSPTGEFRIVSADASSESQTDWVQHAAGTLAPAAAVTPALTLAAAQAGCTESVDCQAYYQQLRSRGLEYGDSFQGLQQLWRQGNQALARVQLPEVVPANTADAYQLHPVLMDAGFQLLFATLPDDGEETYLPVGVGQLQLLQPVRSPIWIHGKIHSAEAGQPIRRADLHIFDQAGQCLARLQDLQVRRIQRDALRQLARPAWQDWLYRVAWRPQPVASREAAASHGTGQWLLLADRGGVAAGLARQLVQQGNTCTQVSVGETLQLTGSAWQINPQRSEDWQQLCEAVICQGEPLRGVVHFWGADIPQEGSSDALQTAQTVGVKTGLMLTQGLAESLGAVGGKLWFVTRGTQAVETSVAQVGAAPLWGLGRAIALEQPEIWGGLIDLAADPQPQEAEQLLSDLQAPMGDAIAFRQQRQVARLTRTTLQQSPPLALKANATYLITGGLGSLGQQLTQHLIDQGAKHLVLVSRRDPKTAVLPDYPNPTVRVLQGDVTRMGDLARVLTEIQATLPPLRGIFHAAGLLDDGLLIQQTPIRFDRVMAPKVAGAWNLHQLTQDLSLDHFMLFSSVAAMLGSPGQANYAAANSFLDSLAHYRQGRGLPGLSVNWGSWADGGMADRLGEREQQRLMALGLDAIAPESGFQALDQLLQQPAAQVGVVPVRWEQFVTQAPALPPLLSELVTAEETDTSSAAEIVTQLAALPADERAAGLFEYLQDQLRTLLRLSPTYSFDLHQGFFDLGMDSLTSVELRNTLQKSLGQPLASTLVFDYPTLDALGGHLVQTLFPAEEEPAASPPTVSAPIPQPIGVSSESVETLSEKEAESLLLSALEAIRY
ncbi:type I polyketide synthase [Romeria aff. gracilis LEGE 07310]|uniref:Type I polyketide synthase n=1 Tax=Vasconcelosia minhoensis LEGE 07310 TaxID=915328 RepID=A0A8J7AGW9_9CYAN|nr:type I polyketide synthase [Romeria gracilis]MBE9077338.1 type I polyketide synthase [Romeria aff. gracilis LEGE 07310]